MTTAISVAILHDNSRPERAECLAKMLDGLPDDAWCLKIFQDRLPEGVKKEFAWPHFKTVLALKQWEWALSTNAFYHLFLTDDLHLAPRFWESLNAMVAAKPDHLIGLLSNHPRGPSLYADGLRWYRCNSWLVGPAYLVPRHHLEAFVTWYKALPDTEEPKCRRWFNDDSALNEWNTHHGPGESWHPLPTIIEHRDDIISTVNHGDSYARERVSWREVRHVHYHEDGFSWFSEPHPRGPVDPWEMGRPEFWFGEGPMLPVGGER